MIIQQPTLTSFVSGKTIKTNVSGSYIGFNATSSNPSASNEVVLGIGITGSGNNTVTLGNTNTIHTEIYGSIYKHQNLIGDNTVTHNLEKFYVYTLSGSFTASLPPSPNIGDSIKLSNFSTSNTGSSRGSVSPTNTKVIVGRNGNNIMGVAQDMGLNTYAPAFEIIYTEPTKGWVIIAS